MRKRSSPIAPSATMKAWRCTSSASSWGDRTTVPARSASEGCPRSRLGLANHPRVISAIARINSPLELGVAGPELDVVVDGYGSDDHVGERHRHSTAA